MKKSKLEPYHCNTKVPRNKPCPCGSGKKAKHCCLNRIKAMTALSPEVRQQIITARMLRPIVPESSNENP